MNALAKLYSPIHGREIDPMNEVHTVCFVLWQTVGQLNMILSAIGIKRLGTGVSHNNYSNLPIYHKSGLLNNIHC